MRAFLFACLAATGVRAADLVQVGDPLLAALKPELDRNLAKLVLAGQPAPYWLAFGELDVRTLEVAGRLGDLVQDETGRNSYLHARVRAGGSGLDNTNFIGYGWGGGGSARLTEGEEVRAVVRDAWLAADAAYKQAIGTLAAKQAALKREQRADRPPDFSPAAAAEFWEEPAVLPDADAASLRELAKRLSAVFREFPAIQRGEVRISARANTQRLIDTQGFRHRQAHRAVRVMATAETQAADGTPLRDVLAVMAPVAAGLPAGDALAGRVRALAERLTARVKADELADPYLGPILFTAPAAAEFMRQTFAGDLCGTPTPVVAEDYYKSAVKTGQLAKFLGLRVLPAWMDVVDDPDRAAYAGTPLLGRYAVDREGVRASRVDAVRDGKLLGFLMSRTPSQKFRASNGHGRIVAGAMCRAAPSNLILEARGGDSEPALLDRLRKMARAEGLAYAIVIRHLDEPSGGEGGPRRINVGTGEEDPEDAPSRWAISPALDVVKVDVATGKETPLRGVVFGPIGIADLRSIVAAGRDAAVYSWIQSPDPVDYYQGFAEETTCSLAAPALLFPQLEVRPAARKRIPAPLLVHPLFVQGGS